MSSAMLPRERSSRAEGTLRPAARFRLQMKLHELSLPLAYSIAVIACGGSDAPAQPAETIEPEPQSTVSESADPSADPASEEEAEVAAAPEPAAASPVESVQISMAHRVEDGRVFVELPGTERLEAPEHSTALCKAGPIYIYIYTYIIDIYIYIYIHIHTYIYIYILV